MQKIIILMGDSGSGKDFVLECIKDYEGIEIIKRSTNRSQRQNEDTSLSSIFDVPVEDIKKMAFHYEGVTPGNYYGVNSQDVTEALLSGRSPIFIFCDYVNFLIISNTYACFGVEVVPIFIYRDINDVDWEQSLLDRGSNQSEVDDRKSKRTVYLGKLYSEHIASSVGENVILNVDGLTTRDDIRKQFEAICKKNSIDISSGAKLP